MLLAFLLNSHPPELLLGLLVITLHLLDQVCVLSVTKSHHLSSSIMRCLCHFFLHPSAKNGLIFPEDQEIENLVYDIMALVHDGSTDKKLKAQARKD
ncbi:hypothetical protein I7I50_05739 [Histoplasma capsulatum G186AR]|uniref:Uncharacterized protein n=1 Tax=Ajellomyces capsulatus TaxID=5037 RepID=A0A8H7Z774_AJECA|nr:hypothetical protein I7I52_03999 [Histoplasma capsulatum]QSS76325.1 hypothetical protein I7I50_05739 [Histoplasma capsulatum G186AR]